MKKKAKNFTITELREIRDLNNKDLSFVAIAKIVGANSQTIKNLITEFGLWTEDQLEKQKSA